MNVLGSRWVVMAAVAVAGVWWLSSRNRSVAPAGVNSNLAVRRPLMGNGGIDRSQTYANPQTMGELLARTVVGLTDGFMPRLPDTASASVGDAAARDAIRRSEGSGYYGWSGPTVSDVDAGIAAQYNDGDPYHSGMLVDSIPAGPVYDVSTDYSDYSWASDDQGWGW